MRILEKRLQEYEDICRRKNTELDLLAKLAAKGPAFFNVLEAATAELIRNTRLRMLGMHPDGKFIN